MGPQCVATPYPLAAMLFYVALLVLFILSMLLLSRFVLLEALSDGPGAALILDGGSFGLFNATTAALHGRINLHLYQEVDTNVSIPRKGYTLANACHPPLAQGWRETTEAALAATKAVIQHLRHSTGPDEVMRLNPLIQSITLLTLLRLFFRLPINPMNAQEAVWIIEKSWEMDGCWEDSEFVEYPAELHRLTKSSPNPSGVLTLLSATHRLVLSAVCLLEHQGDNLRFLRQAALLLQNPSSSGSEVVEFVGKALRSHPPIQSVHGTFPLFRLPSHSTCDVNFFIPVNTLPHSACIIGPDGGCISWLHKALPSQPPCGGMTWLIRTTAIILSAIETEIRQARLTIDGEEGAPEAWEEWTVRKMRVG